MDTFEALYERRSIRDYVREKKEIPQDVLDRIIKSAYYSLPAPGGWFPWRFVMVRKDAEGKNQIAACAKEVAMTMFGASFEVFGPGHLWYMPGDTQLKVAEYTTTGELWEYPRDADVDFIPLLSKGAWIDSLGPHSPDLMLIAQFQGFATQNMWLVGHKYGVGAGYNGMPMLDERRRETNCELLAIPRSWDSTGCFSFGYGRAPRYFGPTRPALEGMTFAEYWGNPYRRMAFDDGAYEKMELPQTEIEDVIANLNYVENFEQGVIPRWQIEKVVDTALMGPMPEMLKNYRVIIIKDRETKEFLQKCLDEKRSSPWSFCWPELQHSRAAGAEDRMEEVEKVFNTGYGKWLGEADTLILIVSTFFSWIDQPDPGLAAGPQPMFGISTGCCIQNMMIAASALGLGMNYETIITGDSRTREVMMDYFGIPNSWWPLGILALGKAGKKAEIKRPPLEQLFYDEYWGNPYIIKTK